MSKQTFLRGTFFLLVAGFITRILGFINRIVVARIMGEEGVGLYMMAVPTLFLVMTLTQLGLPIAISKLVAEAIAQNRRDQIRKILAISMSITGILSIIFTAAMMFLSPFIAKHLLTDARTMYPLLAIAPIVPIIAVSSVLRGYFQGIQNMRPSSYSQVIEQIVRIVLVAVCTKAFLPYGVEYAASGAILSSVIGELASLLIVIYMFKKETKAGFIKGFKQNISGGRKTLNSLLQIALPTTGSKLIGSISMFLEPIVVSQSLAIAGLTTSVATKQYGLLSGYALPLLLLPAFITYALSTSLVPAISEAMAVKDKKTVERRLQQSLRFSMIAGGWSVVILYVFASPILQLMYKSDQATPFILLLAPCFIFYYFQGPLQAVLQALNLANSAMINSFVGTVVKIGCILLLATNPKFGITGVALGICISVVTITILHYVTVLKAIQFTIYLKDYLYCLLIIIGCVYVGAFMKNTVFFSKSLLIQTFSCVSIVSLLYCLLLLLFNLIKKEEIKRIASFNKRIF
ncbi:stage V sporulation protein B [Bacillus sp. RG28]|uniref:Stage V sporulation protein B n=1 Tax=Gottfriedia endophytica TaxID=2820819 RepID=A0A940NJV7_9BACI|nr:stage V sporulation protein B [Gottfriedia endophytica]MBP0723831.1 stage V sporulation protein B [Gottfriedia endophytica]